MIDLDLNTMKIIRHISEKLTKIYIFNNSDNPFTFPENNPLSEFKEYREYFFITYEGYICNTISDKKTNNYFIQRLCESILNYDKCTNICNREDWYVIFQKILYLISNNNCHVDIQDLISTIRNYVDCNDNCNRKEVIKDVLEKIRKIAQWTTIIDK